MSSFNIVTSNEGSLFLEVDGIACCQTPNVSTAFLKIIHLFDTIIEIGADAGGFTLLLNHQKKDATQLISYEIAESKISKNINRDKIDIRIADCFEDSTIQEIQDKILSGGRTLLLCDGGCKAKEFEIYAPFLKTGDVIMCHDYCDSRIDWISLCHHIHWLGAPESFYYKVAKTAWDNGLERFEYDLFRSVLWGAFVKTNIVGDRIFSLDV